MTHTMAAQRYDPWRNAQGAPIPQGCRVEQIAVHKGHGALPSRLHNDEPVRIRPHLARVVRTCADAAADSQDAIGPRG